MSNKLPKILMVSLILVTLVMGVAYFRLHSSMTPEQLLKRMSNQRRVPIEELIIEKGQRRISFEGGELAYFTIQVRNENLATEGTPPAPTLGCRFHFSNLRRINAYCFLSEDQFGFCSEEIFSNPGFSNNVIVNLISLENAPESVKMKVKTLLNPPW